MKNLNVAHALVLSIAALLFPSVALAQHEIAQVAPPGHLSVPVLVDQQSNVPPQVRQAEDEVERVVRRFRIGVEGGVGVDPELIMFGAHGAFGPIFTRGLDFRPGIEFGVGELTTLFGINLDVLYALPGTAGGARWRPYIGAGPNFTLSHRGFETDDDDDEEDDDRNRFDFSDTDFEGGLNFIAGARHRNGTFFELKATAYGVTNVRLLVGFDF